MRRRRCLQLGGLSLWGLQAPELFQLAQAAAGSKPQARSCVFVFLFGGPSHIDLWDMKPLAPAEIRGDFAPISTRTPGIQLCEHLPQLAQQTDKLCLVRSTTHSMNVHGPACSEIYTGREYFGPPVTDQARPEDWPALSALVMRYGNSAAGLPPAMVLPWYTQFVGQDRRIAGQTGGRMGEHWNPFLVSGDPSAADYEVQGVVPPPDLNSSRLRTRRELLSQLGNENQLALPERQSQQLEANASTAWALIEAAQSKNAFAVGEERPELRSRYGPTRFGQSLLLARRLVEAEVPLITVNWDDDSRFDKVSPHWDTHHQNFSKLANNLCPVFDQAFSAFLADLGDRGLLESTLVVVLGEFGRTPRIGTITQNNMTEKTGRDHWPHAFTTLLAGGGVAGGQIYGATDELGGFVADSPVTPADLTATILHHLGIDPHLTYEDQFQQVTRQLSEGRVVSFG